MCVRGKVGCIVRKRWLCFCFAVCFALSLTACGASETAPASSDGTAPPVTSVKPEKVAEDGLEGTNPLTGLPIAEELETLRPVGVMLNDLKEAMPQLGVGEADIIYEIPAEGGITRMLAVYQNPEQVEVLGSIRSTRPYYIDLVLGHDAILIHAGGSPSAYADLAQWKVDNLDGVNGGSDAEIFWRDQERKENVGYEHSMMTSGENIETYLEERSIRRDHEEDYRYPVQFSAEGMGLSGETAHQVSVRFSSYKTGVFDYEKKSGTYLVSQYGEPYVDGNTGEQVAVSNILILKTRVSLLSGDSAGRLSVDLDGEGSGIYVCNGQAVNISWSKPTRTDPLTYTLEDGTPLTLKAGKSYVCVVSNDSPVEIAA